MNENVRVRFAPSPTGFIHVGSLRTALFNYLYAKHTGGTFILRIEDTDQTRKVEGAVESLTKSLSLLGIDYDEGPIIGGDFGPYYQSERLDIYKEYCNTLLENGWAYYAFETSEELEEMRKMAQIEGRNTMYDRRARNLGSDEVKEKLDSGIPYVIRLKVPLDEEIRFDDIVKGTIKIDTNQIDDQVLLKADGYPTYHFANVIDDHMMGITHIIRGEEWITSVPKHILLYRAFGWDVPKMAHVPLILNPDKTKLSKRQGDVAVEDYLKKGYLKEALVNFFALLGWHPGEGEEREVFTLDELINRFTLERVQVSGAVFNLDKLNWMNNEYIKNYELDKLVEYTIPYLEQAGYDTTDKEKTRKIIAAVRVYLNKLDEIGEHVNLFYQKDITIPDEYKDIIESEKSLTVFKALTDKLRSLDELTPDKFKETMKAVQTETGIKGKDLFKPVRIAMTGTENGPELPVIADILGKERLIEIFSKY